MIRPPYIILFAAVLLLAGPSQAQTGHTASTFIDAELGGAKSQGTLAFSINRDWNLGAKRKFVVGFGGRFTSYLGKNQYYITAPAKLTSGSTGPLVIFKENIDANIDTFLIKSAQVNSLNLFVTLGYNFSERLMFRFNIDVVGFSFGKGTRGNYINGQQGAMAGADPSAFNILLISDNDLGSLNSEFFGRYMLSDRWGVKAGIQFHFTEYTTDRDVQQLPEPNDRFRNKSLLAIAGVTFKF